MQYAPLQSSFIFLCRWKWWENGRTYGCHQILQKVSWKVLYKTRKCDNTTFLGKPKNSREKLIDSTKGWPLCPKREPTVLISKLTFLFIKTKEIKIKCSPKQPLGRQGQNNHIHTAAHWKRVRVYGYRARAVHSKTERFLIASSHFPTLNLFFIPYKWKQLSIDHVMYPCCWWRHWLPPQGIYQITWALRMQLDNNEQAFIFLNKWITE